jgi:hypothetical protein
MKVLIQGLGEVPATIELALEKEQPDVTHIICSEYQASHVSRRAGYRRSNKKVIEKAAKKVNTKVIFRICDVFDPGSVSETIGNVIGEISPEDEIIINYTGGSALVRLLLGACAVISSKFLPIRLIYAVRFKDGFEKYIDQTEKLTEIFDQFYELFYTP